VIGKMNPLSAHDWLATLGPLALFVVLFAESALLIGLFLPGDSLLFTAGLLTAGDAAGLHIGLLGALVCAAAGAVLGAQCGYLIGRRAGPLLLERANRRQLCSGAERAAAALNRYGLPKAVLLARFVPVVRTLVNPLAGTLRVPVRIFTTWQIVGGLVWTTGIILAGHWLGESIPSIDTYLLPIIALIVAASIAPLLVQAYRARTRPLPS
jgi:membrane-associated protein